MCAGGVVGGGAVRGGGLLFSLDARPAAAQTPDEPDEPDESDDWPPVRAVDGQGVYGTPEACPDGSEVLFDYKKTLRKFKKDFNDAISDEDRGTVAELVVSAGEKRREVDRSLCVRDLPPCPVSVFQEGQKPTVYMADPADPLFEHRGLDANFAVRSQHVVDFGADFNAAWLAQKEAIGQGYRLSENPKYWRIAAPGRDKPFKNVDADVGNHEAFEVMHPDRCVDAVAEPDPAVVPSDYSECVADKPEVVVPDKGGTASYLPYAKMAFVFATAAEPAVGMCVRFARKACPPGTLLTAVPQSFKPAAAPGDESDTDTDAETPDPVYAVEPIGEMVVQHRCRSLVRRTWTCPVDPDGQVIYEPMNQFNRCTERPESPAAGQSEAPCRETEGTPAREKAFKGFFGAAECDDYVRGNFAADPAACSEIGFAEPGDAGIAERDNPYSTVINYLYRQHTTVLTEVDAGVDHWCMFKTGLLDGACHGSTRLDKLPECGLNPSSDRNSPGESVCLITRTDRGGCVGIVHAVECLAVAAAIDANDKAVETEETRSLDKALKVWQDYQNCAPCTDSPFNPGSGCETSVGSSTGSSTALDAAEQQSKDLLTSYVYGVSVHSVTALAETDKHVDILNNSSGKNNKKKGGIAKELLTRFANRVLKNQELQGALFNRGKDGLLPPLGYPYPTTTNDRPPCANSTHNSWNLSSSSSLDAFMLQYVAGEWPIFLVDYELLWDSGVDVAYLSDKLGHFQRYIEHNPVNAVIGIESKSQLHGRLLKNYNEYMRRAEDAKDSAQPLEACFDLSPLTPGCRVPFNGWLSHRPRNGTEVTLLNMRTDIQVHGWSPPHDLKDGDFRWKPEPGVSEGSEPDSMHKGSTAPTLAQSYHDVEPDNVECGFTRETPHVELVITEMWPDQQLDGDADGDFIKEFQRLFGKDSLDWWGLTCTASEEVRDCPALNHDDMCEPNWMVEDCRDRLTDLQGLRYLPREDPEPNGDLHEGDKRDEILRRNQERVACTVLVPKDSDEGSDESKVLCPWQPSRSGYFRIAAVAVWGIKHCVNQADRRVCDHTDRSTVPYGELSAMTVSEPLGVVVYSATSEGRSVAL